MLGDNLVAITRWCVEVRAHDILDCVCEESDVPWAARRGPQDVDMNERHVDEMISRFAAKWREEPQNFRSKSKEGEF